MRNPSHTDFFKKPDISLEQVEPFGSALVRPECVACGASGNVYVSNWDGGISVIHPTGTQSDILVQSNGVDLKPNGIAPLPDGAFLIANLSDDGGIWQLEPNGDLLPVLTQIDGVQFPPSNFVLADTPDSCWVTVSTQARPRSSAYRRDVRDGFIVRVENGDARIVAEELGYSNECQLHPTGAWLYVNETFSRRLSRYPILSGGTLGSRETVMEFGEGIFPDGLCFDALGGVWITSIVSNCVMRLSPDGDLRVVIADPDEDHISWVEAAFRAHQVGRAHLDRAGGRMLRNISSLAFGGKDMQTAYLGCLLDDKIYRFQSPIAGLKPAHWNWS